MEIDKFDQLLTKLLSDNPRKYCLGKINELIEKKPLELNKLLQEIKEVPGVYVIYKKPFKKEGFIYIGETDDAIRRLKGDISRGKKRYHTFLRKLSKEYPTKTEEGIKEVLEKDYLFAFVETKSKEIAFVIEGILIRLYHTKNKLLNTIKKYQK